MPANKARLLSSFGTLGLTNRIRQNTWNIDPVLNELDDLMQEIHKKIHKLTPENFHVAFGDIQADIIRAIKLLQNWQLNLKHTNFYDTGIMYIYVNYILHIHERARKTKRKVANLKKHAKQKEEREHWEKVLRELEDADEDVVAFRRDLLQKLMKVKHKSYRKARNGFTISGYLTKFVSAHYLTRELKAEAGKVKTLELKRQNLAPSINLEKKPEIIEEALALYGKVIAHLQRIIKLDNLSLSKLKRKEKELKKVVAHLGTVASKIPAPHEAPHHLRDISEAMALLDRDLDASLLERARNHLIQPKKVA